jgi:hypothetical protein
MGALRYIHKCDRTASPSRIAIHNFDEGAGLVHLTQLTVMTTTSDHSPGTVEA